MGQPTAKPLEQARAGSDQGPREAARELALDLGGLPVVKAADRSLQRSEIGLGLGWRDWLGERCGKVHLM